MFGEAFMIHTNSELDELFDEYFPVGTVTINDRKDDDKALLMSEVLVYRRNKFKQQILSNYLPKADLVEYLNGLRDYALRGGVGGTNYELLQAKDQATLADHNQLLDEIIKYIEEK